MEDYFACRKDEDPAEIEKYLLVSKERLELHFSLLKNVYSVHLNEGGIEYEYSMLPKVFFPALKIGGSEELKLIGTHLRNLSVKNSSTAAHKPQNCPFFEGLGNNIGIKYLKCSDSFIRNPVMDSVLFSSTFPVLERLDLCVTVPHLINDTFSLLQFQVENVQCNFPSENLTTFNDVSGFLTRPAMENFRLSSINTMLFTFNVKCLDILFIADFIKNLTMLPNCKKISFVFKIIDMEICNIRLLSSMLIVWNSKIAHELRQCPSEISITVKLITFCRKMAKNYRERLMAENAHEQRNFNYFEAGIINVLNGNIVDRNTMEAKIILNAFNHEALNTLSMISHNKKIVYEDETTFLTPL